MGNITLTFAYESSKTIIVEILYLQQYSQSFKIDFLNDCKYNLVNSHINYQSTQKYCE